MTLSAVDIDVALCRAFGKRPGESLLSAAERCEHHAVAQVRAASLVLRAYASGDVGATMRAAHAELLKLTLVPVARAPLRFARCRQCVIEKRRQYTNLAVNAGLCALHAARARRAAYEAGEP